MPTEDDIPYINRKRLTWSDNNRLGEGSFGIVYRGLQDNAPVAIKVVKRPSPSLVASEDAHQQALAALRQHRREIHRLAIVQNPFIIQYLGVFRDEDPHDLYIVTEFLEGGSLHDSFLLMRARRALLDEPSFLRIALHIAYGLNHVHSERYTHGDVKPQNVLLTSKFKFRENTNNDPQQQQQQQQQEPTKTWTAYFPDSAKAKIADFGLSKRLHDSATATADMSTTLTATGEFGHGPCGTFLYMAPEAYRGVSALTDDQVTAADVYAYALILYELLTGLQSWALERVVNPMQLMNLVGSGRRPSWGNRGDLINPLYIQLVEECWAHETERRPTFHEIISTLRALEDAYLKRVAGENDPQNNRNNANTNNEFGSPPTSVVTTKPSSSQQQQQQQQQNSSHPSPRASAPASDRPDSSAEQVEVVDVDVDENDVDCHDDNDPRDSEDATNLDINTPPTSSPRLNRHSSSSPSAAASIPSLQLPPQQPPSQLPQSSSQSPRNDPNKRPSPSSPQRRPRPATPPMPSSPYPPEADDNGLGVSDDGTFRRVQSELLTVSAEAALRKQNRNSRNTNGNPGSSANANGGGRLGVGETHGAANLNTAGMGNSEDDESATEDEVIRRISGGTDVEHPSARSSANTIQDVTDSVAADVRPSGREPGRELQPMSDSFPNQAGINDDTLSGPIGGVQLQHVNSTRLEPNVEIPGIVLPAGGMRGDVEEPRKPPRSETTKFNSFLAAGNNYVEPGAQQNIAPTANGGPLPEQRPNLNLAPREDALRMNPPSIGVSLDIGAALAGPAASPQKPSPEQPMSQSQNQASPGTSTNPSDGSEANQAQATVNHCDDNELDYLLSELSPDEPPSQPQSLPADAFGSTFNAGTSRPNNAHPWQSDAPPNGAANIQPTISAYNSIHHPVVPQQMPQPPHPSHPRYPPLQPSQQPPQHLPQPTPQPTSDHSPPQGSPIQPLSQPDRMRPPRQSPQRQHQQLQQMHMTQHRPSPSPFLTASHLGPPTLQNLRSSIFPTHAFGPPPIHPTNPNMSPPFQRPAVADRIPASNTNVPPITLNPGMTVGISVQNVSFEERWTNGQQRQVAHELANDRGSLYGDDMLRMVNGFLGHYVREDGLVDLTVFKDLSTAIGNIARRSEYPIRKDAVAVVIPHLLRAMHRAYNAPQPGPIYTAVNYALCNLFKVNNVILDPEKRSKVAIWIVYSLHWNLVENQNRRHQPDVVLGYAATSAVRNFLWCNRDNITAFLAARKDVRESSTTVLLQTMQFYESKRLPLVVSTAVAALAPIVQFPRFRLPFVQARGLQELIRLVSSSGTTPRVALLSFSMIAVLFSGPLGTGDDRFDGLVSDELVNNGAASLVQSLDVAMRLDQGHRVGGEGVQLEIADMGYNAVLQGLKLSSRVRRTLLDAQVTARVASALNRLLEMWRRIPTTDSTVLARRARLGEALCKIVQELGRDANEAAWMRGNGVTHLVDELMRMEPTNEKGFRREAEAAVIGLTT